MKAKTLAVIFLMGCVLCAGCQEKQAASNENAAKHSVSESMMANDCSTYQAMEDQSDIIVYGKKVREYLKEPDFEGDTYDLMAEFEIEKQIKKGDTGYKDGDIIKIAEGITYDPDPDIIYHEGGYQKMQTGKAYYLMLGTGDAPDQYYLIGGLYGKVPEDTKEDIIYKTNELGEVSQEEVDRAEKWIERNRKELEKN